MQRSTAFLSLAGLVLLLSGCAIYGYEDARAPHPRDRYPDRRDHRVSRYYDRVDGDVYHHTRDLQRRLRLSRLQAQRIDRLLRDRTYYLLERTSPYRHQEVYPFPRRYADERSHTVRQWWASADRRIEAVLSRAQRQAYRALIRRSRYDRDRRYEPYYDRDARDGRYEPRYDLRRDEDDDEDDD